MTRSEPAAPYPAPIVPGGTEAAPSPRLGFVARFRELFGWAEVRGQRLADEITLDPEEWLEYHNPTLGLYRGDEESVS